MKTLNLNGQQFGYWTVHDRGANDSSGRVRWKCVCVCGKTKPVLANNLMKGTSTNCGCMKPKPSNTLLPYEALYNQFLLNVRGKHTVDLTYGQFLSFAHITNCHYCDGNIKWTEYGVKKNGGAYHLDRMDNSLGYSQQNCVVCCKECNRIKGAHISYTLMKCIGKVLHDYHSG